MLATELSELGSEGLSFALFDCLNGISTSVIAEVGKALAADNATLNITSEDVTADAPSTRMTVFWCMTVVFALNLCALVGVFWLPRQKKDAQKLRAYGGYNPQVALIIACVYLAAFSFTLFRGIYLLVK